VTGLEGAEGKDQTVFLNSGELKRVLMGSLAGPESPSPCSHRTKLRAIGSAFEDGWFGCESSINKMVPIRVIPITAMGFANSLSFIAGRPWSTFQVFPKIGETDVKRPLCSYLKSSDGLSLGPNVCRTSNKAT
jgi:hypothetical protein